MTPQERKLIDELFDRLATLETNPRDADAVRAINDGLQQAPNAIYPLVQSVLVQDEALKRADARIRELEGQLGVEPGQSAPQPGGFLDTMRDTLFGKRQPQGSVPSVPPAAAQPARTSGLSGGVSPMRMAPAQPAQSTSPWAAAAPAQPAGIGTPTGGSFLGTAAAAAAGVIGGSLLMNSFRNMFGHHPQNPQSFYDQPTPGNTTPWSPSAGDSQLARDAGLNDIGRDRTAAYDDPRQPTGLFDSELRDTDNSNYDVADTGDFDVGGDTGVG